MLYLTCTTITSVDLAQYGVSRAKDWISVDCGTNSVRGIMLKVFVSEHDPFPSKLESYPGFDDPRLQRR